MTKRPRRGYDPQARLPHLYVDDDIADVTDLEGLGVVEPGSNPTESETSLVRSSALVAVGTMLSRVTGFARIAAIAYALGASTLAGTYSYANEAPNIVYELLLGGVLTATLVPLFVKYHETDDDDAPSAIFTVAIVALAAITVIGVVAAPWIVELYTLNVKGSNVAAQQQLATDLLRLFMPQMLFYGIVTLATAMLNARRRFLAAAFAPVLNNIVVIAVFLALPRIADGSLTVNHVLDDQGLILLIGLGTTAGVVVMALALLPPLKRLHTHLRFLPRWRHPAVLTMLRLSGWTVGYVIANQIALLVVTILANGTDGGPFIYISAYAFFQLPHGLFAVSLMTTFTPEMASAATRGDLACVAHAAVARHPARGDGHRARVRALHRSGAPDHRRTAATRRVLGRRCVGGVRHAGGLLGGSAAVLHLPVRDARVLRRATTRTHRSGSTASRTS